MSFDGVFLYHITQSLTQTLSHARCEQFFYDDQIFYMQLYKQKQKQLLVIDLHAHQNRIFLSSVTHKKEGSHPLLQALNVHLSRSIITQVHQHLTDRVLILTLTKHDAFKGDSIYQIIIEFMGKHANMILLKDNIIIEAFKRHVSHDGRSVLPNVDFSFFPSPKISLASLKPPFLHDASYYVNQYLGLTLSSAKHMIETQKHPFEFDIKPTFYQNQMYCFYVPDGTYTNTLEELMQLKAVESPNVYIKKIENELKKLQSKSQHLLIDLDKQKSFLPYREVIERIYQEFDIHTKKTQLDNFILDVDLTLHENAQHLSKLFTKAKRAIPQIEAQLTKTSQQIHVLDELLDNVKQDMISKDDLILTLYSLDMMKVTATKNKVKKVTHYQYQMGSVRIIYGKNAYQNNFVTHQLADKNDIFIHVKDAPGAHVIIQGNFDQETFMYALRLAAFHSKLRHSSSIPVMYTKKSQVSKIPGVFGSHVKIKSYQTMYVDIPEDFIELCD
jgi:predicted ribosome quality control (RQC) complex YloA/Tae2 family protein